METVERKDQQLRPQSVKDREIRSQPGNVNASGDAGKSVLREAN